MFTKFITWVKARFNRNNKKAKDGFTDNPYLIL